MKASEALAAVNRAYVPGIVDHYDKQSPDLWQKAHDDWEKTFCLPDESARLAGNQAFAERCLELIERFKRDMQPQVPRASDALNLPPRFDTARSVRKKECAACRGTDGLRIVRLSHDALNIALFCAKHGPQDVGKDLDMVPMIERAEARMSPAYAAQAIEKLRGGVK